MKKKKWLGSTDCDMCNTDCTKKDWFVDAMTKIGCWALMCPHCYNLHGRAFSQKYNGKTKEKICDLHGPE